MLPANFKPKRTAAASRGFLAQHGFLVTIYDSDVGTFVNQLCDDGALITVIALYITVYMCVFSSIQYSLP